MTHSRIRRVCKRVAGAAMILCGTMLTACKPDVVGPPSQDMDALLWSLKLNHHAVVLSLAAPYDTVQLIAIPRNVSDVELESPSTVTYTTTDTTIRLNANGFVRASSVTPSAGARVVVKVNSGQVTLIDTAFIHVKSATPPPSVPRTFFVARTDADSLKDAGSSYIPNPVDTLGSGWPQLKYSTPTFIGRVVTMDGDTIALPVYYSSSDNTVSTINRSTGVATLVRPGVVTFYATSYVYGTLVQDSVQFTVGLPLYTSFYVSDAVSYSTYSAKLGVGAVIDWQNAWSDSLPMDVIFENPAGVAGILYGDVVSASGNIIGLGLNKRTKRSFPTPGTYRYHISTHPQMTGTIVIVRE